MVQVHTFLLLYKVSVLQIFSYQIAFLCGIFGQQTTTGKLARQLPVESTTNELATNERGPLFPIRKITLSVSQSQCSESVSQIRVVKMAAKMIFLCQDNTPSRVYYMIVIIGSRTYSIYHSMPTTLFLPGSPPSFGIVNTIVYYYTNRMCI